MKKTMILSAVAVAMLTSCGGGLKSLSADNFKVVPNPLETEGGQVQATINGMFPEQYMNRKAVVTVTPELRYTKNGVQQALKGQSATFQGEKVMGNDQTISYLLGGHYTMKTAFPYEAAMQQSDLFLTFDAKVGKKEVKVPAVKVATGVIATSELYHQTVSSAQPCVAPDAFQRITEQKLDANVKFLIQQAELRKSELQSNSVQDFVKLLQQIARDQEGLNLSNVEISAYASPDGGLKLNEQLANKRQQNTESYVRQQLKNANLEGGISSEYTAQDWEGFQELVKASNIQDKDVILRVLSMYQDPQEREQQIKNMSQGFRELAEGVLPELRRARMTINYEVIGRDDEQIFNQYQQDASKLSVEELIYAASIANTDREREDILKTTARLYTQDARAYNNLGTLAMQQGNYEEAKRYFQQAQAVQKLPETSANLGLMALQQGDVQTAENLIAQSSGASGLAEALGNLHLAQGNYALAQQDFGYRPSNSAALAQLLNKDYARAQQTLKNIKNPDGITDYLAAIVQARQENYDAAASFLRSALQKNPGLKTYADKDLELVKVQK
ncbi:lipopolysaccharide assembly protein LapB [Prevotella sp. tf2-5]|uniref:tetratricopeptide repeat protein n=1 Tax=Prevotella sp. tf2-5 TaxID=1761889 RepID=UPI0008EEF369|nr:tetratricopeptide repeat protein [Prevotella sp. tf2-5]SFO68957.1 TPR repeat-containing protein [Prevotella sp. tf2-5]